SGRHPTRSDQMDLAVIWVALAPVVSDHRFGPASVSDRDPQAIEGLEKQQSLDFELCELLQESISLAGQGQLHDGGGPGHQLGERRDSAWRELPARTREASEECGRLGRVELEADRAAVDLRVVGDAEDRFEPEAEPSDLVAALRAEERVGDGADTVAGERRAL